MEKVILNVEIPLDVMKAINEECTRSKCSMADVITNAVYNNRSYLDTLREVLANIGNKEVQKNVVRGYVRAKFMHQVDFK